MIMRPNKQDPAKIPKIPVFPMANMTSPVWVCPGLSRIAVSQEAALSVLTVRQFERAEVVAVRVDFDGVGKAITQLPSVAAVGLILS